MTGRNASNARSIMDLDTTGDTDRVDHASVDVRALREGPGIRLGTDTPGWTRRRGPVASSSARPRDQRKRR
jgi:hypothetical protein